jgi:hypothetical protein
VTKVWIVAGLIVVAVATAVILLNRDPETEQKRTTRKPPARLQESEVRAYLSIMPRYWEILNEAVQKMENARPRIETLLRTHHHDLKSWRRLQERVEFVVNVVRWEGRKDERDADIDKKIKDLEGLRETARGADRERIDEQIAKYRSFKEAVSTPLHPEDRELVKRFWTELDRFAAGMPSDLGRRGPR